MLVQQARDQRLVRQALRERALLDRFQVLAREPDVQPPVFAEGGLSVARVSSALARAARGGFPLTALDGLEQPFLVRALPPGLLHTSRRTPMVRRPLVGGADLEQLPVVPHPPEQRDASRVLSAEEPGRNRHLRQTGRRTLLARAWL